MNTLSSRDNAQLLRETTRQFWLHIVPIVWLALGIHIIFLILFIVLQFPSLAAGNVVSIFVYVFCLKAIRAGRYSFTGILMSIEIILHALLATWKLGWDSNFYFYLYCLIPIIAFSFQHAPVPRLILNFAIVAVSVAGFALRGQMGINSGVGGQLLEVIGVINVFAALSVLLHCTALSVGFTRSVQSKLFHTANRDSLTNLYTRRRVMQEVGQLSESGPTAIILLDVDHFKQINDRLGHEWGDLILKRVAEAIGSHVRTTDVASRWGGEEFLILMPLTSAQVAKTVADNILSRIRNWAGQTGDKPITVTATLAVSEIRPAEDFESALLRADQALYQGKQQGRDQVILAS